MAHGEFQQMDASQLSSGEPFKPGDTNYAYSNYCKRLCTWSLNVALHQDSTCNKKYESTLEKTIAKRVDEGAKFFWAKSKKPSSESGFSHACLNLRHAYFGCEGTYKPDVSKRLHT